MSADAFDDDLFEDAPPAPTNKYPTIKQLGTGDKKVKVVYARGEDNEVIKDTAGRLCIFRPVDITYNVADKFNPGQTKDQIQCDVILLTGPPITEVIDQHGEVTGTLDPPKVPGDLLPKMYINQTVLVGQFKQLLNTKGQFTGRMSVGRLVMLPDGRKPWAIGTAADAKQKDADIALARKWFDANKPADPLA